MGLIPTPINDGSVARTIALRGQVPSAKSIKTEYFEPGGNLTIQTEYAVTASNARLQRNVIRLAEHLPIDDDGTTMPAVVNISIAHDKRHDEADLTKLLTLAFASLPSGAARTDFVRRLP